MEHIKFWSSLLIDSLILLLTSVQFLKGLPFFCSQPKQFMGFFLKAFEGNAQQLLTFCTFQQPILLHDFLYLEGNQFYTPSHHFVTDYFQGDHERNHLCLCPTLLSAPLTRASLIIDFLLVSAQAPPLKPLPPSLSLLTIREAPVSLLY